MSARESNVVEFNPRAVRLPGDLAAFAEQYMRHIRAQNYSANTVAAYQRDLEQFTGYLASRDVTLIQIVTEEHITGFLHALLAGEGNAPRTAARKLESVRGLFRFAARRGLISRDNNPAEIAQPPKWYATPPGAPAKEAVLGMIRAIPDNTPIGLRDRAMFRLMLDGALRVDALCSLDLYDPKKPPNCCVYPNGRVAYRNKGGRVKETVVDDTTLAWLERWLAVRDRFTRMHSGAALFLSERGNRMQRQTLHARIKEWGAAAGMGHLHAHLLRHCRARDLIEREGLATASHILGHARQSTTSDMYGEHTAEILRSRARRAPLEAPAAKADT